MISKQINYIVIKDLIIFISVITTTLILQLPNDGCLSLCLH